jgi:hypothetical protein
MTCRSVVPILSTEPQPTQEHLASMNTTNATEIETLKARIVDLEAMLRRAQVPVIQAGYSSMGFEIGKLLPSPLAVPR